MTENPSRLTVHSSQAIRQFTAVIGTLNAERPRNLTAILAGILEAVEPQKQQTDPLKFWLTVKPFRG